MGFRFAYTPSAQRQPPIDLGIVPWGILDTYVYIGDLRISDDNTSIECAAIPLLNFSANLVFAVRSISFYAKNDQNVIIEETGSFLKIIRTGEKCFVNYYLTPDKEAEQSMTVDWEVFLRAVGSAHAHLLLRLFRQYPQVCDNLSFLDGYPDARLVLNLFRYENKC